MAVWVLQMDKSAFGDRKLENAGDHSEREENNLYKHKSGKSDIRQVVSVTLSGGTSNTVHAGGKCNTGQVHGKSDTVQVVSLTLCMW